MRAAAVLICMALACAGCGGVPKATKTGADSPTLADQASQFMAQGDYFRAAFYWEAALAQSDDTQEVVLLVALIEAQVRAHLLHAALRNLNRLQRRCPDSPAVRELFEIIVLESGISIAPLPKGV